MPLLKSLKGQSDLIEINLKRVMLEDSGMKLLCQGLPTSLRVQGFGENEPIAEDDGGRQQRKTDDAAFGEEGSNDQQ